MLVSQARGLHGCAMHAIPPSVPGSRIVERVPLARGVEPWPDPALRRVSQSWRGPIHMQMEGVDLHLRYIAQHDHFRTGRYPRHNHPYTELLLTVDGAGVVECEDGETFPARPNTVLVMPAGESHATGWSVGRRCWRLLVIDFDLSIDVGRLPSESGDTLDPGCSPLHEWFLVRRRRSLRLRRPEQDALARLLHDVQTRLSGPPYGLAPDLTALFLRLVALLSTSIREQGLADGRHILRPAESPSAALLSARIQLETRVRHDPGAIRRLATAIGYAEAYFIRAFRAAFGVTPKHYAQTLLMRRACGLLENTDLPVHAIARRLAYGDAAQFSRAFRHFVGISPEHYRLQGARRDGR